MKILIHCTSLLLLFFGFTANALDQKPMVVIIPSYNNAQWIEKNLTSVFTQQYDNYRVIYIDDYSQDQTYQLAQQVTKRFKKENRTIVIRNTKRYGALANLYTAIHSCGDECIIVTLDGDDWLADEHVLEKLNNYYERDVWMTYGQFQEYPTNKIGHCIPFPETIVNNNTFRTFHTDRTLLPASHLRTFYAWLFKSIKLEDLLYQNSFYSMGWDIAFICPMLEMSGHRQVYIEEILYIYNRSNPISDCYQNASLQRRLAKYILRQQPYARLESPVTNETLGLHDTTSIILLASHGLANIFGIIAEILTSIKPIDKIYVLYQEQNNSQQALEDLSALFPSVTLLSYNATTFKSTLQNCIDAITDNFVLCATDNIIITDPIDCTDYIRILKKTNASALYFGLAKNEEFRFTEKNLAPVNIDHSLYAWFSTNKKRSWSIPTIDCTLWQKTYLQNIITSYEYATIEQLANSLQNHCSKNQILGLIGLHATIKSTNSLSSKELI